MGEVPGFVDFASESSDRDHGKSKSSKSKNQQKSLKKMGGFKTFGLSFNLMKGVIKRGYQQPTPIQRQTIPLVLQGKDVVAMARTGSGKTACFLIPLFEKLKARNAKTGARALILSPTRELALQTLKFFKELGRFVGLKSAVILGGDTMEEQFSAIHENPDVIVATPGRFLHICVEMDLKLSNIEYVVFDEADRLFEMGLGEQLNEIVARLPDSRQTVLFSATLPKILVEFAKVGLTDPVLIRLDVESKIPETLQLWYLTVRQEERLAALLVLLQQVIGDDKKTIIFAATKHHVEYIHMILDKIGINNTYIYSSLDATARKINAMKFSMGKVNVLVVTDIAARGIDIPLLDCVINYNFPSKPKLFVHRVGRCARAGKSGTAYSLVAPEEYAYLLDLHLFLGRPLNILANNNSEKDEICVGQVPQSLLEEQQSILVALHEQHTDLVGTRKVSENGYQQYVRTRPAASTESNRRIKSMPFNLCSVLQPVFKDLYDSSHINSEEERKKLLDKMKFYRPQGTIFEICGKNKSQEYLAMKEKKLLHKDKISTFHSQLKKKSADELLLAKNNDTDKIPLVGRTTEDGDLLDGVFDRVIVPKKRKLDDLYDRNKRNKRPRREHQPDLETFVPYLPTDRHTEAGLAVNSFENEASKVQFDMTMDSEDMMRKSAYQQKKWDRKKKKMVAVPDKRAGKIRTESGAWIPETYKSNRYAQWKEKSKIAQMNDDDEDEDGGTSNFKGENQGNKHTHWAKHNRKMAMKQKKSELKTTEEILKARKIAAKKKAKQHKKKGRSKNNKRGGRR